MLKSDSRSRSLVGRMSCERGAASGRPLNLPPTTRMRISFLRCCLPDAWLLRRRLWLRFALAERSVEIGAGGCREFLAQLVPQHAAAHFLDFAGFQVAELERAVGDAD